MSKSNPSTDLTLIARLVGSPGEPGAWGRFVRRYRPCVVSWCRAYGLQPADADDVAQEVMVRVARQIAQARPGERVGSFRAWLRTIVRGALSDHHGRLRPWHEPVAGRDEAVAALDELPARDDLLRRLDEEYDLELVEVAMKRVRERVESFTWEAFHATAIAETPVADVAARLGRSAGWVYAARSRVQRAIREELIALDAPGLDGGES